MAEKLQSALKKAATKEGVPLRVPPFRLWLHYDAPPTRHHTFLFRASPPRLPDLAIRFDGRMWHVEPDVSTTQADGASTTRGEG